MVHWGYNLSVINIKLKGADSYSYQFITSTTAFWTKPYKINLKSTISPGVFIMASPYSYNNKSGSTLNYNIAGLGWCWIHISNIKTICIGT